MVSSNRASQQYRQHNVAYRTKQAPVCFVEQVPNKNKYRQNAQSNSSVEPRNRAYYWSL